MMQEKNKWTIIICQACGKNGLHHVCQTSDKRYMNHEDQFDEFFEKPGCKFCVFCMAEAWKKIDPAAKKTPPTPTSGAGGHFGASTGPQTTPDIEQVCLTFIV